MCSLPSLMLKQLFVGHMTNEVRSGTGFKPAVSGFDWGQLPGKIPSASEGRAGRAAWCCHAPAELWLSLLSARSYFGVPGQLLWAVCSGYACVPSPGACR